MGGPEFHGALIVGAGEGLSAALARRFAGSGLRVALASRNAEALGNVCSQTGARAFRCDATRADEVAHLFDDVEAAICEPDVVVYNASGRVRGPIADLDPEDVGRSLAVTAFGGLLVAQHAARRMLRHNHGAILFTGASASVKGYPQTAPFAMGKFALRGLAQSMARELSPQGIHVAHFVIDGSIARPGRMPPSDKSDSMLDPDAIAEAYVNVLRQPRSAWSSEVELRPWVERF